MNRTIYNHAECFMRRFKLKISASVKTIMRRFKSTRERHCLDAYRVFYGKSSNYWSL